MFASGCTHLLLTTDYATAFNAQIDSGDFRMIDLRQRPYGLPEPVEKIDDGAVSKGRWCMVRHGCARSAGLSFFDLRATTALSCASVGNSGSS